MPWIFFLFLLVACAGRSPEETAPVPVTTESTPSTASVANGASKPAAAPAPEAKAGGAEPTPVEPSPEMKALAALFDQFVQKKGRGSERRALEQRCEKEGDRNALCSTFHRYDELEGRMKGTRERKARSARVRPRIVGKEVKNWDEVKADSFNHLIKTFSHVSRSHLDMLRDAALADTACPNNAAIAAAATLEDRLPDGIDPLELAQLYEKGGDCLTQPDDRENFLTRAGLFYYFKKEYKRALAVWRKAGDVDAAKSPRPLYWLHRLQSELGDKSGAAAALTKLKEKFPFQFHTVMARVRAGQDPDDVLDNGSVEPLLRSRKVESVNPLLETAEILRLSGFPRSATRVLDWANVESVGAEPELRVHLADMKSQLGEIRSALLILAKLLVDNPKLVSRKTLALYYPRAYHDLFVKHAEGLDPYLLLAVARQESAFDARAVSSARAKGLLQLLPRRVGTKDRRKLFDPETNIRAGSRMLSHLIRQNGMRVHLALGGYNAGPLRVVQWTRRYTTQDPVLYVDLIPFKETRAYVALILRNYYWYRRLNSPNGPRLPWLAINEEEGPLWLDVRPLAAEPSGGDDRNVDEDGAE